MPFIPDIQKRTLYAAYRRALQECPDKTARVIERKMRCAGASVGNARAPDNLGPQGCLI
jgi:hypothetical protein